MHNNFEIKVEQDANGIWFCRPYLGRNVVTHAPLRPYKRFPKARDEGEAREAAREWLATIPEATELHISKKLGDMLYQYLDVLETMGRAPNTLRSYRAQIDKCINPYLGAVPIDQVKPYALNELYGKLISERGLSLYTVRKVHFLLQGAFNYFQSIGFVEVNPVKSAKCPRQKYKEAETFNDDEVALIMDALKILLAHPKGDAKSICGTAAYFACYLALQTGMRLGEILALRRSDINLTMKSIHISGTMIYIKGQGQTRQAGTKSGKSRNIAIANSVCESVRNYLDYQNRCLNPSALAQRTVYLCCNKQGNAISFQTVERRLKRLLASCGIEHGHFHTLRHTHATMLLMNGVDLKTVSERLGHAKETTTLQVYAHVLPGRDAEAARVWESLHGR